MASKKSIKSMVKPRRAPAPEPQAEQAKWVIVDKQDRGKLNEGRNQGFGSGFAKRAGNVLTMVNAITACRDFHNDLIYSELTAKPYAIYGQHTVKTGMFESDTRAYMVISILKQNRSTAKYGTYDKDVAALNTNYQTIQRALNVVEERLKLSERTIIDKVDDNLYAVTIPLFWTAGSYLISLHGLLMRSALYWDGAGDPIDYWTKLQDADVYYLKAAIPKLKIMIDGYVPKQDMNLFPAPHNIGISQYPFPPKPVAAPAPIATPVSPCITSN